MIDAAASFLVRTRDSEKAESVWVIVSAFVFGERPFHAPL